MATSKSGGSTSNGRDSIGRRLGTKKYAGEVVQPGDIIIQQYFARNAKPTLNLYLHQNL